MQSAEQVGKLLELPMRTKAQSVGSPSAFQLLGFQIVTLCEKLKRLTIFSKFTTDLSHWKQEYRAAHTTTAMKLRRSSARTSPWGCKKGFSAVHGVFQKHVRDIYPLTPHKPK